MGVPRTTPVPARAAGMPDRPYAPRTSYILIPPAFLKRALAREYKMKISK
ncbi:hypothetical protein FTUN_2897 [Frigoriglobus tundricola]|uniref:Uncharacterized protein n=1 Tax=Frigoriglobus tundricola TaxID=2774151 RepID=A0A6M5YMJ9_9BACT|nr:hypothetical protein FTUN_2897 [Frigoriglobus tundricola]